MEELPDDAPRMSALLADIAEPMLQGLELPEQEDEFRAGLMLAAAVWNASTFRSRRRRRKALAAVKRMSDVPLPEELGALCDQVFERARSRYPDERRTIADVELVRETESRFRINVLSAQI